MLDQTARAEATIQDYLRVVFRRKLIIVIPIIIIMLTVFVKLQFVTKSYQTQVKMLVVGELDVDTDLYKRYFIGRQSMSAYADIVTSRTVLERVIRVLKLDQRPLYADLKYYSKMRSFLLKHKLKDLEANLEKMPPREREAFLFDSAMNRLRNSIDFIFPEDGSLVFSILVTDLNPAAPVPIANALSRSFIIYYLEQQVAELQLKFGEKHSNVMKLQNYINRLTANLSGNLLSDIEAMGPAGIKIIEQAQGSMPVKVKSPAMILGVAFVVSTIFSLLLAFVVDFLDQTFKSPQDVETYLNVPVLCSIPKRKNNESLLVSEGTAAGVNFPQIFNTLSDQVYLLMRNNEMKTLLITDAEGSADTAAIIAKIGESLTHRAGHKVLIIDTDFRHASLSRLFDINSQPGLIDILEEKADFEEAVQIVGPNLHILPAYDIDVNPVAFLDSTVMKELLRKTEEWYNIILISCSDLKKYNDAVILSSITDATVLVVNEGKVRRQVVAGAIGVLRQKHSKIVGTIFNNRTYEIPDIIYRLT